MVFSKSSDSAKATLYVDKIRFRNISEENYYQLKKLYELDFLEYKDLTMETVDLKQGPGFEFPTIMRIPEAARLRTLSSYKNWFEVELLDGIKGWLNEASLTASLNEKSYIVNNAYIFQCEIQIS